MPQSRDPEVVAKRMGSIYSIDERMVKRKSHDNEAIQQLYKDYLGHPLSHKSHHLLHTSYTARPRQLPVLLKSPDGGGTAKQMVVTPGDDANNIYIVYGTQSGTSAQAAKDIKIELQQSIARAKLNPEPTVFLVAGNNITPDTLAEHVAGSMATIFVTCTYGEGEMPEMIEKLWDYFEAGEGLFADKNTRVAVFGLCSSRYDVGDQYNRAARRFDARLVELGAERLVDVGAGDDQNSEGYRGALDPWLEQLKPKLFAGGNAKVSLLDPPDPLFKISLAPSAHASTFRPLPPGYNFITLESFKSVVSEGYDRPAGLFSFSLQDTGLEYKIGDHLAILPRNPKPVVDRILSLYGETLQGSQLLIVEAMDPLAECPYPKVLSIEELLAQYLDLCGRPSRSFFKQLFLFATSFATRNRLRSLFERDTELAVAQDEFDAYTDQKTFADVLCEYADTCLPPFEYLLSMLPLNTPRFYSIASSPLAGETQLDLLVVMNTWIDSAKKDRVGLNTRYLFDSAPGDKFAVQIHTGILQPPDADEDLSTPVVMFCLGAGLAPFVGFCQHRQAQLQKLQAAKDAGEDNVPTMGPATLYFGSRHRAHDYYLEDYFQQCIKEGALTAIYTAFSRDGLSKITGKKQYVYNAIAENPMGMANALGLEGGLIDDEAINSPTARVYYCGSANGIPEAIQDSMLQALISSEGIALSREDAKAYMDHLVNIDKRFHSECF